MKRGQQVGQRYNSVCANRRVCVNQFKRHVRRDDHELVVSLTVVQFLHQPVKPFGIETALLANSKVFVRHRIVEHDDLDWHIGPRLEAVTGKVIGDVGLGETVADGLGGGGKELTHPVAGRQRIAVGIGGNHRGVGNASNDEVGDRTNVYDVTVRRAAVNGAHVIVSQPEHIRVGKVFLGGHNGEPAHPEVIVVAEHCIPGDGRVKPRSLEGLLIIYGVGAGIGPGARGDILPVHDIDEPAEFVILRAVGIIAEGEGEIERGEAVDGVGRPDGGVENLRRIEHHR